MVRVYSKLLLKYETLFQFQPLITLNTACWLPFNQDVFGSSIT
jgi:hypothetical protein